MMPILVVIYSMLCECEMGGLIICIFFAFCTRALCTLADWWMDNLDFYFHFLCALVLVAECFIRALE